MKFGLLLNRITTPIVLGVVFYLVIFPIGLIVRLTGRDPMTRNFDDGAASYRVESKKPRRGNTERPF